MMGTDQPAPWTKDVAAQELYRAELALHDAHQTHVDEWISAASEHLHHAITQYLALQDERAP